MSKKAKRVVSMGMAAALALSALPLSGLSAVAAGTDYSLSIETTDRQSVVNITADQIAAGDVTIPVGIYIHADALTDSNYITEFRAKWESKDSNGTKTPKNIQFDNVVRLDESSGQDKEYTYSAGKVTTKYPMYALAAVTVRKSGVKYTNPNCSLAYADYIADPIFGNNVYSAGKDKVKFTATYWETIDDCKADIGVASKPHRVTKEYVCDVTYDADGIGHYSYDYSYAYAANADDAGTCRRPMMVTWQKVHRSQI